MNNNILANRHDILILFDATNSNPNGDPDAGNLPRQDPNTSRGLVSDVCLKRKVRNFVKMFPPEGSGFGILVEQGAVLNKRIGKAFEETEAIRKDKSKSDQDKAAVDWLCREFYDVRAFGGVLSTGEKDETASLRGSAYGQVRGPVQFSFAQSYHPITPIQITVTRCAVTKEEDAEKERTMGHKFVVPYALYCAKVYVSPAFAERTVFTQADLDLLFQSLEHMFDHDQSAARPEMRVCRLYDFEHVGTQDAANEVQNRREARLGCAPAHRLFEGVRVRLKEGREFPQCLDDYVIDDAWGDKKSGEVIMPGVRLHRRIV